MENKEQQNNPNVKRFTMRLMDTRTRAADKSLISRPVWEKYLASPEYKTAVEKHLINGGITHLNRHLQNGESGVGPDDSILINSNITHIIERVYFKDANDPCVYADCVTLDPNNFAGEQREKIQNLIGMLASGMFLPISIVIEADWSPREEATEIIRLLGADLTLNPSFKGAGIVKIFSEQNSRIRMFSGIGVGEQDELREFSIQSFITDKMVLYKQPAYVQLYKMLTGYRQYFLSHPNVKPENFKALVIQDFSHILNLVMPKIRRKANLSVALALRPYGEGLIKAMEEYRDVHYMTMIFREATGFIPKGRYQKDLVALANLYNEVIKYVTNGRMSLDINDKQLILY